MPRIERTAEIVWEPDNTSHSLAAPVDRPVAKLSADDPPLLLKWLARHLPEPQQLPETRFVLDHEHAGRRSGLGGRRSFQAA